jgi:hypothetical protein
MKAEFWLFGFIRSIWFSLRCFFGFHTWNAENFGDNGIKWKHCNCGWWFKLKSDWYKFKGDV